MQMQSLKIEKIQVAQVNLQKTTNLQPYNFSIFEILFPLQYQVNRKDTLNIQLISKAFVLITGYYNLFDQNMKAILKEMQAKFDEKDKGWILAKNYVIAFRERVLTCFTKLDI